MKRITTGLAVLLLTITACRRDDLTEVLAPTSTVGPAAQSISQESPESPSFPRPTRTLAVPGPTFTPVPTTVFEPPPTLSTIEPIFLTTLADFGLDRNPLTGELMDDPVLLQRRPIAVKISNAPARYVRPQSGLSQADLVFEHVTEGPITRFTAVIFGQTPLDMGPIRSARLIDLEIPAMYDAALAYSGSSIGVSRKLFSSDFRSRILRSNATGYYRTGADKPYEHTLYGDPSGFWEALDARDENRAPLFTTVMTFGSEVPDGGEAANVVTVRYREWTTIDWRYDTGSDRYLRWADGEKHIDASNGEQVSAANVMLLFAGHELDTSICEYQSGNQCLAHSMQINLYGRGPAILLRNGQMYDASWRRDNRSDMITIMDEGGTPLPLAIGNSWFQIIPINYPDPLTIDG